MKPAIYYLTTLPLKAGGELVNLQHVASLRKLGWRAFALLINSAHMEMPIRPLSVPMVQWKNKLRLNTSDWLVMPEATPLNILTEFKKYPCQRVIHNQNPFYSFRSFASMDELNSYPLSGGLCCSRYTRDSLLRWGSKTDWQVVHPMVLPIFQQLGQQQLPKRQIAYMPRKRPGEAELIRSILRGLFPQFANIPWVELKDASRQQVAEQLSDSLIFASLGRNEGLGLPPLEAMAANCVVCGFTGGGGQEYATQENGIWVDEGDYEGFACGLAQLLESTVEKLDSYIHAGRATAANFSAQHFEAMLDNAWHHLLGNRAGNYRTSSSI